MANIPNIKSPHDDSALNTHNRTIDTVNQMAQRMKDLVANGQLTPAQYAEMTKILNGLPKKGELTIYDIDFVKGQIQPDHLSKHVREMMAGTTPVLNDVADHSITGNKVVPKSLTMNELAISEQTGDNLFSGSYYHGFLGGYTTGGVYHYYMLENRSDRDGRTAIIPVKPNTTYRVRVVGEADRCRVGSLSGAWDFSATGTDDAEDYLLDEALITNNAMNSTVTTNSTARYLLVNVSVEGKEPELIVSEGISEPLYRRGAYIPKKHLEHTHLTHDMCFTYGTVLVGGGTNDANRLGALLERKIILSPGFIVGLHDYSKYNIALNRWSLDEEEYFGNLGRREGITEIQQRGLYQVFLRKKDSSDFTSEELEECRDLLFVEYNTGGQSEFGTRNFVITDDIEHEFEVMNMHDFGTGVNARKDHEYIYGLYDDLVADFPHYVTKETIGTAASDIPMYAYTFTPNTLPSHERPFIQPKFLCLSGTHGNEHTPVLSTYSLFNMMCKNWRDNKLLEFFRHNIKFVVVPLVNPSGYDAHTRQNANGVDINRDWPTGWEKVTSPSSSANGDAPFSQSETVHMRDFFIEHSDAAFGVDYHNTIFRDQHFTWMTVRDEVLEQMANRVQQTVWRRWQKEYSYIPQTEDVEHGFVRRAGDMTTSNEMYEMGISALTAEISREMYQWTDDTNYFYDARNIKMGTEYLAEILKSVCKLIK